MIMVSSELRSLLPPYINFRGEGKERLREVLGSTSAEERYSIVTSVKGESGYTAVHRAAKTDDLSSLQAMLQGLTAEQHYNTIKIRSIGWKTALHFSACLGHTDIIKLILSNLSQEQKVNILKIQDPDGCTPLHSAAYNGHSSQLQIMVTSVPLSLHRKFLHIKDNQRMTIADIMPLPKFPHDVTAWTQLELNVTSERVAVVEAEVSQGQLQLRTDLTTQQELNAQLAEKQKRDTQKHTRELDVTNERLAALEIEVSRSRLELRADVATQQEKNAELAEKHERELNAANERIAKLEVNNDQLREEMNSQAGKLAEMQWLMKEMVTEFRQTTCVGPEMNQEYEADI